MKALIVLGIAFSLVACGSMQRAAAQDPMRCERDPKCDKKRGGAQDCSTQCNDDPACMDRCEEIQASSGAARLGH